MSTGESVESTLPDSLQVLRHSDRVKGLTQNPNPPLWTDYYEDFHPSSRPRESLEVPDQDLPRLAAPTRNPKSIRKLLRFARVFWNMIRRPAITTSLPVHLQMESTDACNLHCTSCSRDMIVQKARMLDAELWKKVIREIRPSNINVSGIGEPFLNPQIFEIIQFARERGAAINCATNFTRVKGRHRQIVECGISQLKVSIDAATRETYRVIRGEDEFEGIIENLKEIRRWKKKLNKSTPSVRFNFALQRFNYQELPALLEMAPELGVDGIYVQYLSYNDMEERKTLLTADMTREGLKKVLEETAVVAKKHHLATNLEAWERDFDLLWKAMLPMPEYEPNRKQCYFPWMSTWLSADGWVRPCPVMPWTRDEGRMGNLAEQSFSEIWNNRQYRELREALARGERPTRSCKTCYPQDLKNILMLKAKLLPK